MAKKTLRVALVMGGGVSLGAFSGGALSEVVRQLCTQHNRAYSRVTFDVFSGASAGGITLALLLRALANPDGRSIDQVIERVDALERLLWVEQTSIQAMLPEPTWQPAAILSRKRLEAMVVDEQNGLRWPDGKAPQPDLLADRVCFGVSLMNYNGLRIEGTDDAALQDAKSTTLYGDYRYFCLDMVSSPAAPRFRPARYFDSQQVRNADTWYELYSTAVAGGAFPIAFESVVLERHREEFPDRTWPEELGDGPFRFTYGDGGAFNNEPLREAMRMIAYQDGYEMNKPWREEGGKVVPAHTEDFDRILVYIDPDLAGSSSELELSMHVSSDLRERIVGSGMRLITAVRGQAAFKDVLASDEVDNRLKWRGALRDLLLHMAGRIEASSQDGATGLGAEDKLKEVLKAKGEASQKTYDHTREVERVYWEEHKSAAKPYAKLTPEERERYSLLALVDQVAALRAKQEVRVIAIAPGDQRDRIKLAGDFLAGFGGFLEQDFRDHDYRVGQDKARTVLSQVQMDPPEGHSLLKESVQYTLGTRAQGEIDIQVAQPHREENAAQIGRRIRQILQLFVRDARGWFTRELGRLALPLIDKRLKKGLSGALEPKPERKERHARLRLTIGALRPNVDQVRLAQERGVLRSPLVPAGGNGDAILETGISYSEGEIRGRYVFQKENDAQHWWTRVHLRKGLLGQVPVDVRLPTPEQLWNTPPQALHSEEISFAWPAAPRAEITEYKRSVVDRLETHAEALKVMANRLSDRS